MGQFSLWKGGKGADYRFFDRVAREQLETAGVPAVIHKYLGPDSAAESGDRLEPGGGANELSIQNLLFLSNRDRSYDPDVYVLKGHYTESDLDFEITQFAVWPYGDVIYMTFHLNRMVDVIGRKLMNGDVIEMPNMLDEHPLDADSPPIPKFYKVEDGSRPAEGYSPLWLPHLWRIKMSVLTDSQEYSDILDRRDDSGDMLREIISTYDRKSEIKDEVAAKAVENAPGGSDAPDMSRIHSINGNRTAEPPPVPESYDDLSPDQRGDEFPVEAKEGDLFLREDFAPAALFRKEGSRWVRISNRQATWEERKFPGAVAANASGTIVAGGKRIRQRQSVTDAVRPGRG